MPAASEDMWAIGPSNWLPATETKAEINSVSDTSTISRYLGPIDWRNVPKTHVEKLEQKLDGLVSLIKSTQETKSSQDMESNQPLLAPELSDITSSSMATQPIRFLTPLTDAASSPQDQISHGTELSQNGTALPPFVPIGQSSSFAQIQASNKCQSPNSTFSNSLMHNFTEANVLLNLFRDQITPYFPLLYYHSQCLRRSSIWRGRSYIFP
jgi:hypothetical protein